MDETRLTEIEARLAAVPEHPLTFGPIGEYWAIAERIDESWNNDAMAGPHKEQYAELFAHAPADLRDLVADVRRLREELTMTRLELNDALEELRNL